ncbi:YggS family pyridoxal phosphate-dependent enzyme [Fodinibius halophilus]|uniref:Pyridoxal phosphate homeostasis protein n=1 Tax=Fodinibius halophilus TaxID=1736908 RepID=A0A6M1T037_9BACT|nr:YggS family pyridoxal phosphate-dependent enzyme [Fodinibius halophilus]NGP87317.1 YggS family pyridoxal phosphate-dependent enzyme [Fodinibius halophilus]
MSEDICQNLSTLNNRITEACKQAGRDPKEITLVAVSKMKPLENIKEAFGCGQIHFGENRAKELQDKMEAYEEEQIQWHMVGNLQTNKIKYMVERVNWIHSIEKSKYLREIEKRASRINRTINTLIQINISGEDQKSGCEEDDLEEILTYAQGLDHVRVCGLMGMASFVDPEEVEKVRPQFQKLRQIRDNHRKFEADNVQLDELSMGMTNDMEVAIEEGATMVRVGRAIFGERNY